VFVVWHCASGVYDFSIEKCNLNSETSLKVGRYELSCMAV
jgi:hypothetical protein